MTAVCLSGFQLLCWNVCCVLKNVSLLTLLAPATPPLLPPPPPHHPPLKKHTSGLKRKVVYHQALPCITFITNIIIMLKVDEMITTPVCEECPGEIHTGQQSPAPLGRSACCVCFSPSRSVPLRRHETLWGGEKGKQIKQNLTSASHSKPRFHSTPCLQILPQLVTPVSKHGA